MFRGGESPCPLEQQARNNGARSTHGNCRFQDRTFRYVAFIMVQYPGKGFAIYSRFEMDAFEGKPMSEDRQHA